MRSGDAQAMTRPRAMAYHALARQVRQSAQATGVAAATLLAYAPLAALVRAVLAKTRALGVPLGEVTALLVLGLLLLTVSEELVSFKLRGSARLWHLARVITLQVLSWTAIMGVATHLAVKEVSLAGIPLYMLIYLVMSPVAVCLNPRQSCHSRLRRTVRDLFMGIIRLNIMCVALSVLLYVYLTVFTDLGPALEVLVMGLAMPIVQAACMSLLAWLSERQGAKVRRALRRKAQADDLQQAQGKYAASSTPSTSASAGLGVTLVMVLCTETLYSTGALATLMLAESDKAFYLSLVAMLVVEVVQVALHVKARRVMSRVVAESTAEALLGDNQTIREWLLYQELGEKVGLLVALGFICVDKAHGRDVAGRRSLGVPELAQRGVAMIVLELVSDLGKDVVSQVLGVMPSEKHAGHVSLSPVSAGIAVLMSIIAAFLVQASLSLGSS